MLEAVRPVPHALRGLWRRTVLQRPGEPDDGETRVFWLQGARCHMDLRVPGDRPDFSGRDSLEACEEAELRILAAQEAFCGVTRFEAGTVTWCRFLDLSPARLPDVGRVRIEGDRMTEQGILDDYWEEWELVPGSRPEETGAFEGGPDAALEGPGAEIERLADGTLALTSGHARMTVTPRGEAPQGCDPYASPARFSRAQLEWRGSLAVTLWRRGAEAEPWRAELSTHPWMENRLWNEGEAGNEGESACA